MLIESLFHHSSVLSILETKKKNKKSLEIDDWNVAFVQLSWSYIFQQYHGVYGVFLLVKGIFFAEKTKNFGEKNVVFYEDAVAKCYKSMAILKQYAICCEIMKLGRAGSQ